MQQRQENHSDKKILSEGRKGIISCFIAPGVFEVYENYKFTRCNISKEVFNKDKNNLVVGDKVTLNRKNEINGLVPRKTLLVRLRGDNTRISIYQKNLHLIAANVDVAIIVSTVSEPKFSPGLIDRYLILCQYGAITPLICINKCDLSNVRPSILEWYSLHLGIQVVETSLYDDMGIQKLLKIVEYKTVVFVGASGVGKSTIISRILGKSLKTQNISQKGKQGKHTTTTSSLFPSSNDTYIIDTPGIRNLAVEIIHLRDLKQYFPEFKEYEQYCKYADCSHSHESSCAVKEAQKNNPHYQIRYKSYLRIFQGN